MWPDDDLTPVGEVPQQMGQAPAVMLQGLDEPFTQGDAIRLRQLQAGLSKTRDQVEGGLLSPVEGLAFRQQLLAMQAPLLLRQEKSRQKQMAEVEQQAMRVAALGEGIEAQHELSRAKNFPLGVASWRDPFSGQVAHFFQGKRGQWEQVQFAPEPGEPGAADVRVGGVSGREEVPEPRATIQVAGESEERSPRTGLRGFGEASDEEGWGLGQPEAAPSGESAVERFWRTGERPPEWAPAPRPESLDERMRRYGEAAAGWARERVEAGVAARRRTMGLPETREEAAAGKPVEGAGAEKPAEGKPGEEKPGKVVPHWQKDWPDYEKDLATRAAMKGFESAEQMRQADEEMLQHRSGTLQERAKAQKREVTAGEMLAQEKDWAAAQKAEVDAVKAEAERTRFAPENLAERQREEARYQEEQGVKEDLRRSVVGLAQAAGVHPEQYARQMFRDLGGNPSLDEVAGYLGARHAQARQTDARVAAQRAAVQAQTGPTPQQRAERSGAVSLSAMTLNQAERNHLLRQARDTYGAEQRALEQLHPQIEALRRAGRLTPQVFNWWERRVAAHEANVANLARHWEDLELRQRRSVEQLRVGTAVKEKAAEAVATHKAGLSAQAQTERLAQQKELHGIRTELAETKGAEAKRQKLRDLIHKHGTEVRKPESGVRKENQSAEIERRVTEELELEEKLAGAGGGGEKVTGKMALAEQERRRKLGIKK